MPGGGNRGGKGFSDLTVSAILDERKMQTIAESAVQAAMLQLRDRYVSMDKYMGILHEQDNQMKRLKVQTMTMRKYAVARMIRFSAKRNKFRMREWMQEAFDVLVNHAVKINTERILALQKLGNRFVSRFEPVVTNFLLTESFEFWSRGTKLSNIRERMRPWMKLIAKKWLDRVKPDMEAHFRKWSFHTRAKREETKRKRNAIERQSTFSTRQSILSFDATNSRHGGPSFDANSKNVSAINSALLAIQELNHEDGGTSKHEMHSTNVAAANAIVLPTGGKTEVNFDSIFNSALVDEHDLLIKDLTGGFHDVMTSIEEIHGRLNRINIIMEENMGDMEQKMITENKIVLSNMNTFKSSVTVKFNAMQFANDEVQGKLRESLSNALSQITGLSSKVNLMDDILKELPSELAGTIGAQQVLTDRMDEMDTKQSQLGAKIKAIDGEIVFASKAALSSVEHSKKVEEMFVDSTSYFDVELKSLKKISTASVSRIAEIVKQQEETDEKMDMRMKAVEKKQDAILPAKPTPDELFELCSRFEVMQQRLHKEGSNSKKLLRKADALMNDLADFTNRLAANICDVADLSVLIDLMGGVLPTTAFKFGSNAADPSNGLGKQTDPYAEMTKINNKANEGMAAIKFRVEVKRNELLDDFIGKFIDLLRSSDSNPGITRSEARVKFHRKFSSAIDAALSKHFMMKQQHPDALSKNSLSCKSLQTTTNTPSHPMHQCNGNNGCMDEYVRPMSANVASGGRRDSAGRNFRQFGAIMEFADSLGSPEASEHWVGSDGSMNMLPVAAATARRDVVSDKWDKTNTSEDEEALQPIVEPRSNPIHQHSESHHINRESEENMANAVDKSQKDRRVRENLDDHFNETTKSDSTATRTKSSEIVSSSSANRLLGSSQTVARPSSARVIPSQNILPSTMNSLSRTAPSTVLSKNSPKSKPTSVRAAGFKMPSSAVQAEFAAILAENFKKDATFCSQNSVALTSDVKHGNQTAANSTNQHVVNNTPNLPSTGAMQTTGLHDKTSLTRPLSAFRGQLSNQSTLHNQRSSAYLEPSVQLISDTSTIQALQQESVSNSHGSSGYASRKLVAAKDKLPKK